MTNIEDEARDEAEQRWPSCYPSDRWDVFVQGAVWAASRQREGAPSAEDVAAVVATHTPVLVNEGPNGEDDGQHLYCNECGVLPVDGLGFQYGPEHVAERVVAALLYAPAPDTKEDQ